jgi:hypothetical protein
VSIFLLVLVSSRADHGDRFGWVNASYVYGLSIINVHMRRALGTITPYETFARATQVTLDDDNLEIVDEDSEGASSRE